MPRGFTDYERKVFRHKLQEEAVFCLKQYGMRKTTVDEITSRAGIAKGSFYQFYQSKEMLFLEVIYAFHDEIQAELLKQIERIKQSMTADKLTDLIFNLFGKVEESFLYPLMQNGDLQRLISMVPNDNVKLHTEHDDLNMKQLLSMFPELKQDNLEKYSAALRGIFFTMFFKREIGSDIFPDALKAMIHGIILQMYADSKSDGDRYD